ncbi:3-phosphoshikimate 1-carboxyvinyltransferase, partial [Shigella flexneri]|nr:3-phosphoshikimate 1-carboxyvinyltransferase [Shigella flexneri]
EYLGNEHYPPLHVGEREDCGERVIPIKGNVSSQFLTALLMALPLTGQAFEIRMVGELISKPYIDITLKLMAQFGVQVANEGY